MYYTANFQSLSRIAFVFELTPSFLFLDNAPMFVLNEQPVPSGENMDLLIALIRQFQIQNIDFLACGSLNVPEWKAFYYILGKETNVVVGASSDNTGNVQYGGDWIMETSGQDVELLYFTQSIEYYKYLLGSIYSYSSFVIATNGTIYCCGWNTKSQLGLGSGTTDTSRNYWSTMDQTNISGLLATYISTGGENPNEYHTLVVMTNGALYGCGTGSQGTLTNVTGTVNKLTLLNNTTGSTFTSVSASPFMSFGITASGGLWGWGYNSRGELANGTTSPSSTMVQYSLPSGTTAIKVCGNTGIMYVLLSNGTVYGAGSFNYGKAGAQGINTSATNNVTSLTQIVIPNNDVATKIACGYNSGEQGHLLILCANGNIYGTGANGSGQLGIGNSTNPIGTLTQMVNSTGLTPVDIETAGVTSYVLMNNNALYVCGDNGFGQYGNANSSSVSLTLSTNSTGKVISRIAVSNSHAHMLMTDGTLYGTGYNAFGQLGLNNNTHPITTWTVSSPPTLIQTVAEYSSPYSVYSIPCFHEGSKILTDKGYRLVQDLRRGDLIQTLLHGFLAIDCIGYSMIYNSGDAERVSQRLYRCSPDAYPELLEDLIITGCHSILIDDFKEGELEKTKEMLGDIFVTDDKWRLPAAVDERAIPYEKEGTYTIWHFALENADYYMNYGIYANGLLVETSSKRYMKEESNMILVE